MNIFFADHNYVFLFPIENEVIERRNRSTDLHCCSLDTLPLALSPLTLFPFNETCSSVDNIFAVRTKSCWISSKFYPRPSRFGQPLINIA